MVGGYYAQRVGSRQGTGRSFGNGLDVMKRLLAALLALLFSVPALVLMGFAGAYQFLAPEIPSAATLRAVKTQMPLRIYSRDGKLIAQIGEQRRIPVAWDDIPDVVVDAFLAAEDDRFFEHPGVDWQGLVRALAANVAAGGLREGGGTITMQLARNTVLTSERTLRRKLKEVFLALRLEREFTKQEILTLYLNRIFLGQRAYGIGAASEVYFDKHVRDLGLAEAALLAGLPRAPSVDNPVANVERAHGRRAYVLRRMLELGKIDAGRARRGERRADREPPATDPSSSSRRRTSPRWCARRCCACTGPRRSPAATRSPPRSTAGCSRPRTRRPGARSSSTSDVTATAGRSSDSTRRNSTMRSRSEPHSSAIPTAAAW